MEERGVKEDFRMFVFSTELLYIEKVRLWGGEVFFVIYIEGVVLDLFSLRYINILDVSWLYY